MMMMSVFFMSCALSVFLGIIKSSQSSQTVKQSISFSSKETRSSQAKAEAKKVK
jgi:hypothetical protein